MEKRPVNPFLATLSAIAGLSLLVGVILLLVGYRLTQSYDATNDDPTAGLTQLAMGSQLLSFGGVALLLALAAAAVLWRAPVAVAPDPSLKDSL